ncbi:MAG: hypothetical protein ACRDQZ_26690 [Mycobacteriales bacterium]
MSTDLKPAGRHSARWRDNFAAHRMDLFSFLTGAATLTAAVWLIAYEAGVDLRGAWFAAVGLFVMGIGSAAGALVPLWRGRSPGSR